MSKSAKKYLFDISISIEHIFDAHLKDIPDEIAFDQDITVIRAVEREFGIIGEAAQKAMKLGVILTNADRFINRRNTLVHQYDSVNSQTLWQYVQYDLPDLKQEVDELLRNDEPT